MALTLGERCIKLAMETTMHQPKSIREEFFKKEIAAMLEDAETLELTKEDIEMLKNAKFEQHIMDIKPTVAMPNTENSQSSSKNNGLTPERFKKILEIGERMSRLWEEVEAGTDPGMIEIKKGMDEYAKKHPEMYGNRSGEKHK